MYAHLDFLNSLHLHTQLIQLSYLILYGNKLNSPLSVEIFLQHANAVTILTEYERTKKFEQSKLN